eukprot:gene6899-8827_t
MMQAVEAPHTRLNWESAVQAFSEFADAHSKIAEVYTEECCPTADVVLRRIDASRKELSDKQAVSVRKIEAAKASLVKLLARLTRVRRDLAEKRAAYRRSLTSEGGPGAGAGQEAEGTYAGKNRVCVHGLEGSG